MHPHQQQRQGRASHAAIVTLAIIAIAGCRAKPTVAPAVTTRDCPPAEYETPATAQWDLGVAATYEAWRGDGQTVHVRAAGENPSAGYETRLTLSPDRRFPPGVRLVRKPPPGMAATVLTPFDVCATIELEESVTMVRVIDVERQQLVMIRRANER